jgi:PAT family beta-lactamase induction signal transducer AmpG
MAGFERTELINLVSLFILYFVQAMPYGFQSRYLPLVMRKHGSSITSLGFYKLLLMPWICKIFLAALLIDVYKTKRFWLLFSMSILTFGSFMGAFFNEDFTHLAIIIFLLNWASASQDICVDWFSMNALKEEDLGIGNTIQVGYFRFI